LQERPIILRSLLVVATPCVTHKNVCSPHEHFFLRTSHVYNPHDHLCFATPHRWRTTRHYSAARRWSIPTPSTSCATSTRTTRQNYLRESTNLSPLFTPRRFSPSLFFPHICVLFCVWRPRPLAQRARAPQGRTIHANAPTRVLSSQRAGFFSFLWSFLRENPPTGIFS